MAYTVNDIYNYFKYLLNKNQAGGVSAKDLFYSWNGEQTAYAKDLLGRWQAINNGKSGINTGLIQNETILAQLAPFTDTFTYTGEADLFTKPTSFLYTLGLLANDRYKVMYVNKNALWAMINDPIDPPSSTYNTYYYTEYTTDYKVFPSSTIAKVQLSYIRLPRNIVWAYVLDSNGRQQYNSTGIQPPDIIYGGAGYTTPTITFSAPASGGVQATGTITVTSGVITGISMTNIGSGYAGLTPTATITGSSTIPADITAPIVSVQPLWNDTEIIEITRRALKSFGLHFKDADFAQFGNSTIQTGD